MQLAKLEIKGFKSFADKITINFDEGVTGIVGPNGCGKSNIVDSIRWVLGEQKTSALRSEKMENIIFNGTDKRAATQLAEVSLTINNTKNILPTEYSQVTITRRLYRSGESEYLLNGVLCRLKDITNLFLDTGVASNSYAIIELGMVDDLLNDKDHSRRTLFEEAAGISKFKKRKKETLKKLEDTDADLERVEDLLYEIEKNMKSLEKQARQTEKYYQAKEDYKNKSVLLARAVVNRQKERFGSINAQLASETDRKVALTAEISEMEAAIEKAKAEIITKEKELSAKQKAINEFVASIRQYENEKQIKNERLRFLRDRLAALQTQIDQDKQSNERATFAIQSLQSEKAKAEQQLIQSTEELERLKWEADAQRKRVAEVQAEADALRQALNKKQEESFHTTKAVEIRDIQIVSFRQELERTDSDKHKRNESLNEFENKLVLLRQELDAKEAGLANLKNEENNLDHRIQETEQTIEVIREEMLSISRKLDARQNEYNLTKSLVENLEGFPEAIKFLKKRSAKNAPLLSDILTCPEDYRVSIENFLEPYLNYYIVEQEAEAYEAINLLSDAAKGKAHFFILSQFEKFEPSSPNIYDNAFPVTEVVEFDPKYRKLMAYILDGVYMYEGDIKNLPVDDKNTFITKSGKYTKRRFSLSGGSVGLFEGKKIGRAKNLEKLDKEIRELKNKLDTVRQSLVQKQTDLEKMRNNQIRQQIEELQQSIRQVNEEFVSVRTKREQFSEMISNADLRKEDIQERVEVLLRELEELRPKSAVLQQEVLDCEAAVERITAALNEETENLARKSSTYNEHNILVHQQENRVANLDQEIRHKEEAMQAGAQRIEANLQELRQGEEEVRSIIEATQSSDEQLIGMYAKKEELDSDVNTAEKNYYEARGEIDKREKALRELQHNRENVDNVLMELQNQLNEHKLELNSVKERLNVEFNMDLDAVIQEVAEQESIDEDQLREEVRKIRERIDNMGPINPMAMEAFNEIKERHDFITTQKDDLLKAKESLFSTISEIEEAASKTFMDAFNKIKENFIRVFQSLFNEGDDCDLRLVDPEHPLDSEIDIIAKPKGKRPITINQLSGGEKTLTATALLFSMYLLKPAPFCIFDEVDAPLDDANIDKFNNIIRTFSKDSQFVIVTHNKRTMSTVDIIYGITMVEKGVSRVVPVDLRELV